MVSVSYVCPFPWLGLDVPKEEEHDRHETDKKLKKEHLKKGISIMISFWNSKDSIYFCQNKQFLLSTKLNKYE
jgi:hypothetical protein